MNNDCHNVEMAVTLQDFQVAHRRIRNDILRTPIVTLQPLPDTPPITFKLELFQHTGSFKVRGVLNKLATLVPEEMAAGVISMSSGNHAQAVAFGARKAGVPATIVMPSWSSSSKVDATRSHGAKVILTDGYLLEQVHQLQQEEGLTLIHPFDDPAIIAGAGTIGVEVVEDAGPPDLVLVSVGGGGLISGVAGYIKQACPEARIIGIEPEGADVMTRSLRAGHPVQSSVNTIADGLAAPFVGKLTLAHVQAFVEQIVTVSDDQILDGLRFLVERCKTWAEPAAAAAIVPLLTQSIDLTGVQNIVCIVCGGNLDLDRMRLLLWPQDRAAE